MTARNTIERCGRGPVAKARACSISWAMPVRIVDRAIVDAVAVGVGLADAEMVPVRGVDHRLVRARVVPGSRPTTLCEVMTSVLASRLTLRLAFSGTGLKSLRLAAALARRSRGPRA